MVMLLTDTQESYIDLQVYRVGGQAWLYDIRLYGKGFPAPLDGPSLPFTYPPLAAAIKLTPVVFIVFFLAKRQWRAAITSVACFVALGLIGLVAAPQDNKNYWSGTLFDPQRIGGYTLNTNQSIRGELHRLGMSGSPELLTWMMLSLAVVVLGGIAVRRVCAAGDDVTALVLVAAVGLLVSPVSWSHHWVWVAPAVIVVGYGAWRARGDPRPFTRARLITRFVVLMFLVSPIAFMPHGQNQELRWTWWQHLVGNTYLLIAVEFIAGTALRGWRLPQPADSAMGSPVAGPWGCADVPAREPDHPH